MVTANRRLLYFDPLPLRSSRRGRFRPAATRWRRAALSGPGLDPGPVRCPWRGGRRVCLGWGAVLGSIPLASLFLLQKVLYPALGPPRPTNGGILDPVAAVVIGLPTLGCIPKLAPQALCPIVQPTADKLFGCGFDFLF